MIEKRTKGWLSQGSSRGQSKKKESKGSWAFLGCRGLAKGKVGSKERERFVTFEELKEEREVFFCFFRRVRVERVGKRAKAWLLF